MAYPKIFAIRYLVALGLCWGLLTASVQASDPLGDEPGDQYLLGMLFQGEDGAGQARHKAIHWYRQAVQRGNPRMQYAVAMWLVRRTSNPATLTRAADLLAAAARHGLAEAQFEYANWLTAGVLIPADLVKASSYYRKAAEAGHQESRCRLCRIYSQIPSLKHLQSTERHCEICAGSSRQPAPDDPTGLMPPARYSWCEIAASVTG